MKQISVEQYVRMRASLTKEKATLETRLAAINRALASSTSAASSASNKAVSGKAKNTAGPRRGKRAKNSMTMKEAMLLAVGTKSLSRQELLDGVLKLGYKFTAKDPLGSVSTVLYTDTAFKNTDGKFSVAK